MKKEILAYAITHAPRGVEGGPYEADYGPDGTAEPSLRVAARWPTMKPSRRIMQSIRAVVPHARVIRIVRARPSEASATLETARRRLASVAEHMTEHAYQEMASALEVDACRVGPSEASAVEVLRDMLATWTAAGVIQHEAFDRARRVLASSPEAGPDPMPVVRAAMAWRYDERPGVEDDLAEAVEMYRKAGGK
jgi:hypothetical protein